MEELSHGGCHRTEVSKTEGIVEPYEGSVVDLWVVEEGEKVGWVVEVALGVIVHIVDVEMNFVAFARHAVRRNP